jgi:predicted TIM-barrel fold metal-dependent hydrolase
LCYARCPLASGQKVRPRDSRHVRSSRRGYANTRRPEALKECVPVLSHVTYGKTLKFKEEEILIEVDEGVDAGVLRAHVSPMGNRISNGSVAELVRRHHDRLVGLASLDPLRGGQASRSSTGG